MQNNLPYPIHLPKQMPKHMTEKKIPDTKKMIKRIISDQHIIQQFAPKILRAILTNQLEQILRQEPKPTNTKDQEIMELTEQIITSPPFAYLSSQNDEVFTPDEIKKTIYKYNEFLTKITNHTKKTDNIHLLAKLTNILHFTLNNTPSH